MKKSFAAERQFGLTVGGILALLGCWWIYRGKFGPVGPSFASVGGLLFLLGAAAPRFLVLPNRAWMAFAEALSFVVSRLILFLVFTLAVTPIGLLRRLFGGDPLRRRSTSGGSHWHPYAERIRNPRHYEKMF